MQDQHKLSGGRAGAQRVDDRRVISGIVHVLRLAAVGTIAGELWPTNDDLQSLQSLEPPRAVAVSVAPLLVSAMPESYRGSLESRTIPHQYNDWVLTLVK